ncbi:MAG: hypothetical protein WC352_02530 [Candidatus Omnitrophota bacterium]|jgi:hypothetical protein
MDDQIRLLQFFICKDFAFDTNDCYRAERIHSNYYAASFPHTFDKLYAVTCWRKDKKFHKEVLEYATDYGTTVRSPHMDIEPVTNSVLFRWHKHQFPQNFQIEKPTVLTVRVILDWEIKWETYILIEKTP